MKKILVYFKQLFFYYQWILKGKTIPTDATFKRRRIKKLAQKYDCATFIETGTFNGKTVAFVKSSFKLIMSIELFDPLYKANLSKFKFSENVLLFYGDSAHQMPTMVKKIQGRCLFWLDGHYSGEGTASGEKECPVLDELKAIAAHSKKDHLILIDDAREFGVNPQYPTFKEVNQLLLNINYGYNIFIDCDCIIAIPR